MSMCEDSSDQNPTNESALGKRSSSGKQSPSGKKSTDDALYLRKLLETLSVEDPAVFNELMTSNAQLADEFHRADPKIDRLRVALTVDLSVSNSELISDDESDVVVDFDAIVAQIKDRLAASEHAKLSPSSVSNEPAGILTDVTRQLTADQARQLFAKLAPMLVYTTLRHMNCDSSFAEVDRIADRLCSDDLQERLRSAEHTRDALVDEFALALEKQNVSDRLNRDQMTQLLEESGAMADLMAMSNCITLVKSQAG